MKSCAAVFGPVPSRRLGRSLGIDLVPFKTCTYDCIYCQLGRTTNKTLKRCEFRPTDDILREIKVKIKKMAQIDYLTLSGSGETTLYTGIGKLIDALKKEFHAPVAVLTNGSLLGDPDVAESLLKADVVLPTLAADDETVFQCVHRPHTGLHYEQVIKGMVRFSEQFENHLWLELFLLGGVTAMEKTIASMKEIIDAVNPEKIQLNTATRPPAEEFAFPVSGERLAVFAKMLGPRAEVVGDSNVKSAHVAEAGGDAEETVLSLLGRRPCTAIDAAEALSLPYIEVVKLLADLAVRGRVVSKRHSGKMFYQIG